MGVCYYPEHWDRKMWEQDLERMLESGISVIRIGEFAWSVIEPQEGVFTYEFFDEFLNLCTEKKISVIFGTPSATPPVWLTERYPEVLNCNELGIRYRHGERRHYNYNSPKYRMFVSRIVERIAEHYGKHSAIVGWQIDNELNCGTDEFHSEADSRAFRIFLKEKYRTLERLNEAWGTVFWNQTYTQWEQIYVPGLLPSQGYNPHQHLDYYRFISNSAISFCRMQADILRKYKKSNDFITTNGMFWNLDNHRMEEECLDVYTYDSYPNFAFGQDRDPLCVPDLKDRKWTRNLAEVRSVCPHFGIMEQQSGANGSTQMEAPAPLLGQIILWAMQSVAQGADYISFFRWRTCCIGTEIYWHGILDYDNRDNRRLLEVKEFYQKFKKLDALCGSDFMAAFGFLKDYDNEWDTNVDKWHRRIAAASEQAIFEASELSHTPYNYLYLCENTTVEELSCYPVLIYPHPVIMTGARAVLLKQYVEQGGTLILGCRSGYKQENGKCVMLPQPGLLQELTGTDVRDFTFESPAEEPVYAVWTARIADPQMEPQSEICIEMPLFHDIFEQADTDAKVIATYSNSYYAGKAAVMEKQTGRGRTIHLGSAFSREIVKLLLDYTGILSPFDSVIDAPEGVEVVRRSKDGRSWLFVLNFQPLPQTITLKKSVWSVFEESEISGEKHLAPFEVEVFEER